MGTRAQVRESVMRGVSPAALGNGLDMGGGGHISTFFKIMGVRLLTITDRS